MRQLYATHVLEISELLDASGLMTSDIDFTKHVFFGEYNQNKLVATGALEIYKKEALIRSISVSKDYKGTGLGKKVVKHLEHFALEHQVKQIYLLTETASDFFKKAGYKVIDRNTVPKTIATTTQFAELCPQTALCMTKKLN